MQTISNEQTKMKRHWKQMTRCWHTCISAAYKQIISALLTSVMSTCMLPSFVAKTSLWDIICKLTYDCSYRTCNEILNCSSIWFDYDNMQLISVNKQHNYAGILHFKKIIKTSVIMWKQNMKVDEKQLDATRRIPNEMLEKNIKMASVFNQ